jgi:hypothetical protein
MASVTLLPSIWDRLGTLLADLKDRSTRQSDPKHSPNDQRSERDCINELIWNHPELFSSEMDVQLMTHMRRGRF